MVIANREGALKQLLDDYNNSKGGSSYRDKMDSLQESIDVTTAQNEQDNINAARGASTGAALDTAFAPRVNGAMIRAGMGNPKNPMSASNVINSYQQTKLKGSGDKLKSLLSQYYAQNNAEQTARGYDKDKEALLEKYIDATKPVDNSLQNTRIDIQKNRLDRMDHRQVVNAIKKDVTLKDRLKQVSNLSNAMAVAAGMLKEKGALTTQQIDELQQTIRNNLGIKGTSLGEERKNTYFNSLGMDIDRATQYMFGKPVDTSPKTSAEFFKHLSDMVNIESGNIKKQASQQVHKLASGYESMYLRNPDLAQDLSNTVSSAVGGFQTPKYKVSLEKKEINPLKSGINSLTNRIGFKPFQDTNTIVTEEEQTQGRLAPQGLTSPTTDDEGELDNLTDEDLQNAFEQGDY